MNLDPTILEYVSGAKMSGAKKITLEGALKPHFLVPWSVGTGKGTGYHVLFTKY